MQRHQTNTVANLSGYSQIAKTDYRAAIYCRLSKDDGKVTDSSSIQTQKDMLTRYVREQGWIICDYYMDDGYSGLTFERPDFKRMIADIENGKVDLVITKDLSRKVKPARRARWSGTRMNPSSTRKASTWCRN
jgi:DNA invertase Pin-like site-specific DNA recombinase